MPPWPKSGLVPPNSRRAVTSSPYPLNPPKEAVTVQVKDGKMTTTDGPFMETREMIGGLVVIEARDLNEALQVVAGIPMPGWATSRCGQRSTSASPARNYEQLRYA